MYTTAHLVLTDLKMTTTDLKMLQENNILEAIIL
jgi:hypothetical protein